MYVGTTAVDAIFRHKHRQTRGIRRWRDLAPNLSLGLGYGALGCIEFQAINSRGPPRPLQTRSAQACRPSAEDSGRRKLLGHQFDAKGGPQAGHAPVTSWN